MKKPLKAALIVVGTLLAIPALFLATTSVVNVVATNAEMAEIEPYGELVTVDGKQMNVVVSGTGDTTIVLLPGLGTAAPGLDFQPLIDTLAVGNRVIAVEPFGTGLSDQTDAPRTSENIAREVHEALGQLDVDRYVLMGHSISGVYALAYADAYADELIAFVGIDSSVPGQPGADEAIPTDVIVTLNDLGITRLLTGLAPKPEDLPADVAHAVRQLTLLSTRNSAAPTMIDEMNRAPENFASAAGRTFPSDLPVLLFVATEDDEVAGWIELHEAQAASVATGETVLLEGGHYLHHTLSPEIAAGTTAFLETLPQR